MLPKMWVQAIGAAVGVLVGLLILLVGFWKTLLLGLLAVLGWWVCGGCVLPESVKQAVEQIKQRYLQK